MLLYLDDIELHYCHHDISISELTFVLAFPLFLTFVRYSNNINDNN